VVRLIGKNFLQDGNTGFIAQLSDLFAVVGNVAALFELQTA